MKPILTLLLFCALASAQQLPADDPSQYSENTPASQARAAPTPASGFTDYPDISAYSFCYGDVTGIGNGVTICRENATGYWYLYTWGQRGARVDNQRAPSPVVNHFDMQTAEGQLCRSGPTEPWRACFWYERSYGLPRETQEQILRAATGAILGRYGVTLPSVAGADTNASISAWPSTADLAAELHLTRDGVLKRAIALGLGYHSAVRGGQRVRVFDPKQAAAIKAYLPRPRRRRARS